MDESRRLAMRRAHTKHRGYCTCGRVVCGNGGIHNHGQMHKRRKDGHYFMTYSAYMESQKKAALAVAQFAKATA